MTLQDEYSRVARMMHEAGSIQWNLMNMREDRLEQIELSSDPDLLLIKAELLKKFAAWTQPLQVIQAAVLFELYGEAVCLLELKKRGSITGLTVERLPSVARARSGLKTPDVRCTLPSGTTFFVEIKVLDMVGGQFAAKQLIETAFNNRLEMEGRLKPGVTFARPFAISPHGPGASARDRASLLQAYVRRIDANVKKAQLTVGPTFLLIFDARIPLSCHDPSCLVPTYYQAPRGQVQVGTGECVSGDWWYVGFGRTGDLLLGEAEFEGKGNVAGRLPVDGVLVSHPYLFGLSVLSHLHSSPELRLHTLVQSERTDLVEPERFDDVDPDVAAHHFSDAFNDAQNSEGWRYQVRA